VKEMPKIQHSCVFIRVSIRKKYYCVGDRFL